VIQPKGIIGTFLAVVVAVNLYLDYQYPQSAWIRSGDLLIALSWGMIAYRSFCDRCSGYPPHVISLSFACEYFALYNYFPMSQQEPFRSMRFNWVVWALCSLCHLSWIYRYNRKEFLWGRPTYLFWPKFFGGLILYFTLFNLFVQKAGYSGAWIIYVPNVISFIISLHFLAMVLYREDTQGQSFYGNIARLLGNIVCNSISMTAKPDSLVLRFLEIAFVPVDLVYLTIFLKRSIALGQKPWRRI
jgi:hypothetical protein